MALIRCSGGKKEDKKANDLYIIWQPYGAANWVAPRDGKIKASVFVAGYSNGTNFREATCTCFGITVTQSSYSGDSGTQNAFMVEKSGIVDVKKGQVYIPTTTSSGTSIQRYGAYITYID